MSAKAAGHPVTRVARWPWVVLALGVVFASVGLVLVTVSGRALTGEVTNFVAFMGMGVVGALSLSRAPRNVIGMLMLWVAVSVGLAFAMTELSAYLYERGDVGAAIWVGWPGTTLWTLGLVPLLILLPGSWLCRTTPVTRALFDAMPRYLECTYLGIRFAALGLTWIDQPTVRYTVGSAVSESRSSMYIESQAAALRHILRLDLPRYARRDLRARISAAHHRTANLALQEGRIADAWRLHLRTLTAPGGWRYLPLLRHLIRASLR